MRTSATSKACAAAKCCRRPRPSQPTCVSALRAALPTACLAHSTQPHGPIARCSRSQRWRSAAAHWPSSCRLYGQAYCAHSILRTADALRCCALCVRRSSRRLSRCRALCASGAPISCGTRSCRRGLSRPSACLSLNSVPSACERHCTALHCTALHCTALRPSVEADH